MKLLNIACGMRFHEDWINIDFSANSPLIRKTNILGGLPFDQASIDVAYSSHFLEHLAPEQAQALLNDVFRILKPGGILRVVVPDLENICREYLKKLDEVSENPVKEREYDWIVLELLDQLVRVQHGGRMGPVTKAAYARNDNELIEYIQRRLGKKEEQVHASLGGIGERLGRISLDKIRNKLLYTYLKFIRLMIPANLRNLVFCNTSIGERHQWMYDRFSMNRLLSNAGFIEIKVHQFNTSGIPNFNTYGLDMFPDGTPYKGNSSIYIEAVKA